MRNIMVCLVYVCVFNLAYAIETILQHRDLVTTLIFILVAFLNVFNITALLDIIQKYDERERLLSEMRKIKDSILKLRETGRTK